jgi:D-alanyl-D-alanine carboxypeptidase/D-alanyl-D-alanine-endopeptidase (penicillin-binding protein 4)
VSRYWVNVGRSVSATALVLVLAVPAARADLTSEVRALAGAGGVVYAVDAHDRVVVEVAQSCRFVPASTLKVFTALLAAERLGTDWRFETELYLDGGMLVVRGKGDPFLVSEELDLLATELARRLDGKKLDGVAIDDSFFTPGLTIPGVGTSTNPYDAISTATAVNFNTINVTVAGGRIVSAEKQTPLTPLAQTLAKRQKIRGPTRLKLSARREDVRRYAAELIAAKLRAHGVSVGSRIETARAPAGAPLYVHRNSRSLADVCREMLHYSNNYIANQLFLALGAAAEGAPASLDKSQKVAARYIAAHPALAGLHVVEGSGISYDNRTTASALAAVLELFEPYKDLLRSDEGTLHKTGTLHSVRSLVGYLDTHSHGTVRYVIALGGDGHTRRWRIVDLLRQRL